MIINIVIQSILKKKYNLSENGAVVILSYMDQMAFFEHGSNLRHGWVTSKGIKWLKSQMNEKCIENKINEIDEFCAREKPSY